MSSYGAYPFDAAISQVAVSNVSSVILAALPIASFGKRSRLVINVPSTNVGILYLSFGSTVPTVNKYDAKIIPGGRGAEIAPIYQGAVLGILDIAGPENINVAVQNFTISE